MNTVFLCHVANYFIQLSMHPGKGTSRDVALWALCQEVTQSPYPTPNRKWSPLG